MDYFVDKRPIEKKQKVEHGMKKILKSIEPISDDSEGSLVYRDIDGRLYKVHGAAPWPGCEGVEGYEIVAAIRIRITNRLQEMFANPALGHNSNEEKN